MISEPNARHERKTGILIESNGVLSGTRITCADCGGMIPGVTALDIHLEAGGQAKITLAMAAQFKVAIHGENVCMEWSNPWAEPPNPSSKELTKENVAS